MYRLAAIVLAALAGASDPAAAAAKPAVPAPALAPLVIPFELYDNRIYVQVSGPGFGPRPFLLDTGAQLTHYTSELVAGAGLRTVGKVGITGTGTGRIRGAYVAPALLRIGGVELRVGKGVAAPAEPLFGSVYSGTGRRFDGVIGYDLFAAYVVEIDYARRVIRLHERGRYPPNPGDEVLAIRVVDKKPYVAAVLGLDGAAVNADLHIDTGFGGAVSLNGNFVEREKLLGRVGPSLASVGGVTQGRTARFAYLGLGRLRLERPIVSMALVQGAGVRSDSPGRIGGELLRRFTVAFDYAARTVTLSPGADLADPFEIDMSGLSLIVDSEGRIMVWQVAAGSPAGEAGLSAGDQLIGIDRRPVSGMTLEELRLRLRGDGDQRDLLLLRSGGELRSRIRLRRRL